MKAIVSNATPLIYLAKINRLSLLRDIYGKILIPTEVEAETVDRGKERERIDALRIEKAIRDGWVVVEQTKTFDMPIKLHPGEAAALSLAKKLKGKEVLIDEVSARTAARLMELQPRGTVYILLKALELKLINYNDFLDAMSDLAKSGFRLQEEVYLEAIRRATDLA